MQGGSKCIRWGAIAIDGEKRIDWNAIRAEYLGGGISQRQLAKKYGLTYATIRNRAEIDGWVTMRDDVQRRSNAEATQRTAEAAADNAVIAQDLKKRLLLRLQRIEAEYPQDATEIRYKINGETKIYRIRDLTAAYKDLTDDMPCGEAEKNKPVYELLRRLDDECNI